jgi:hypothetical protein
MRYPIWAALPALLLAACAPETEEAPVHSSFAEGGYVVEGDVPAGVDLDALMADLPAGGFLVVGDPETGEIATLTSTSNPLARIASAEFSVSTPAACTNCGDPTCATGLSRTVTVSLRHDTGFNGETYTLVPSGSNFTNAVSTPSSFTLNVGSIQAFSTTGTLNTCNAFSFFFEVRGPNRAFVTSTLQRGNFGGAAGADAICQARANAASLGGTWLAWIADTAVPNTPSNRFIGSTPWVRVGDGVKIADDLTDLTNGNIDAALNRNEFGTTVAPGTAVWTGVTSANGIAAERCTNWSTTAGTGRRGSVTRYNGQWTDAGTSSCNTTRPLYCFEQ